MTQAPQGIGGLRRCAWSKDGVELALDNTLDAIEACLPELERFATEHRLAPTVANRVQVIFEELVANAIRHGFTPGSGQSVQVRIAVAGDQVVLTLEDDGRPFNPLDQAAPQTFTDLETAAIGGLGIPLVRKMAASLRYEAPSAPLHAAFRPTNRLIAAVAR